MFEEIAPTHAELAPNSAMTECAWMLNPPGLVLACTIHGVRTPADLSSECGSGPAVLCHVCLRAVVPCRNRFSWTFLCPTCSRIERELAAPFGAPALTPHEGWPGTQAATLFGRIFPDLVFQEVVDHLTVGPGHIHAVTHDELDGPNPVLLLGDHGRSALAQLGCDRPVLVEEWLAQHPSSPLASAEAYVAYVTRSHDWLLRTVPRITDIAWLTALAAPAGGSV